MPTDIQIIDGFEALRSEFIAANPSAPRLEAPAGSGTRGEVTVEEALDAWLRATTGLSGSTPHERRWIRSVARNSVLNGKAPEEAGAEPEGETMRGRFPRALDQARLAAERLKEHADSDGRVKIKTSFQTSSAEAEYWAGMLPGLAGPKAWCFMRNLGRAVVPPERHHRRLLWRLGMIEEAESESRGAFAAVADATERIIRLTGLPCYEIERLVRWHTSGVKGTSGGARCGQRPQCDGCPLGPGCAWRKFAGPSRAAASESDASGSAEIKIIQGKWDEHGAEGLDEGELLTLLLQSGRAGVKGIRGASALVRRLGGLHGIARASLAELMSIPEIGEAKARQIKAAFELGRRLAMNPLRRGDPIEGSADVWYAFRRRYEHIAQEHFITLLLDTKNRVMGTHLVSKGSLSASSAHPREVFKEAIRQSAASVILMHTHPSGDPEPSREDLAVTKHLAKAGELLGIRVLDHIILGSEKYFSFKDAELM